VRATADPTSAVAPHDPAYPVPAQPSSTGSTIVSVDDTASEAFQAAASGLGGAGIAFAGMWLYRRHQTHIA
jgi:hypothetical protein